MPAVESALTRWIAERCGIAEVRLGPRLGGGNSNLTYRLDHPGGRLILRRAPEQAAPGAAKGIEREYRVLSAVEGHLPAPRPIAYCDDPSVIGAPFILTDFSPGITISTALPGSYPHTPETLAAVGHAMVDALAGMHRIDWQAAGLGPLHRPGPYVERQVRRWLEVRAAEAARPLPLLEQLGRWLLANLPPAPRTTLIHGDYHLENALFLLERPELSAIIDWELATIGDPLADLGLLLMFWGPRPVDPPAFEWVQKSTRMAGVIPAEALAERWSRQTGIGVGRLDYYRCFAFWKLAAVVEGTYLLYRKGLVDTPFARGLERGVPALLEEAALLAEA
jgi:aminoglycoside phosphotransferase (APT) family kinase protein